MEMFNVEIQLSHKESGVYTLAIHAETNPDGRTSYARETRYVAKLRLDLSGAFTAAEDTESAPMPDWAKPFVSAWLSVYKRPNLCADAVKG